MVSTTQKTVFAASLLGALIACSPADMEDSSSPEQSSEVVRSVSRSLISFASDNFNRTESVSLGTDWVSLYSGFSVVAGKAIASGSDGSMVRWHELLESADHYAQVTVEGGHDAGVFVRVDGTNGGDTEFYSFRYFEWAQAWALVKSKRGEGQILIGILTEPPPSFPYMLRLAAYGNSLKAYVNGTLKLSASDSDLAHQGVGIISHASGRKLDDFRAGPATAAPCDPCSDACSGVVNVRTDPGITALAASLAQSENNTVQDDYYLLRAAADYASSHPGVSLVYPYSTYYINRHISQNTPNSSIRFKNLENVRLIGCGSTISVDGNFRRSADYQVGSYWYSFSNQVIPFDVAADRGKNSSGFTIEGFNLRGNVHLMSRDPGVAEGTNYGIRTASSRDYVIRQVSIAGFATDGLLLGTGAEVVNAVAVADRNAMLANVTSSNNGRNALTIAQLRGGAIVNSRFRNAGVSGGSYGGHSPQSGVDIEPDYGNLSVDHETGDIRFENCDFSGNVGSQFIAGYRSVVDSVTITDSSIEAANDYPYTVVLSVPGGVLETSLIDTKGGAVYATWDEDPNIQASTVVRNCSIRSSGYGLLAVGSNVDVIVSGCTFHGTHASPGLYMPYIQSTTADFVGNDIFTPKAAFDIRNSYTVAGLLQDMRLSSGNTFTTDLVPGQPVVVGGPATLTYASFWMGYDRTSRIVGDQFLSGSAYVPYGASATWVQGQPYSSP